MAVARNIGLNLVGQGAPLLAAAFCIPPLIQQLGTDRFGVLTIAWMVIGYFSLFDLGLGRALTRSVAEKLALQGAHEVPRVAWTSLALMAGLGLLACVAILVGRVPLVDQVLKVPAHFRAETLTAFTMLALSVPFVIVTTGLRGLLEAYERFDLVNLVRVPMGVWTFVGPLLVLPLSTSLDAVVAALVAGRVATTIWHAVLVDRAIPVLRTEVNFDASMVKPLIRFGGWMTVSNVISPMMVYMDRFFISAIAGIAVVAFYTTPYEVVFKLNVIPEAVFGVLFPLMTARLAAGRHSGDALFSTGIKLMAATMFPVALVTVLLARPFLGWWLGAEFEQKSTLVMQLLVIGLFVNSMAKVPYNLVQAQGRADLTAKIHMIELPLYVGCLIVALKYYGILGAAAMWAMRMALDFALLTWAARHAVGLKAARNPVLLVLALAAILLMGTQLREPVFHTLALLGLMLVGYSIIYYKLILSLSEKNSLKETIASRLKVKNG